MCYDWVDLRLFCMFLLTLDHHPWNKKKSQDKSEIFYAFFLIDNQTNGIQRQSTGNCNFVYNKSKQSEFTG
jgi:hypothetical protein